MDLAITSHCCFSGSPHVSILTAKLVGRIASHQVASLSRDYDLCLIDNRGRVVSVYFKGAFLLMPNSPRETAADDHMVLLEGTNELI